MTLTTLTPSSRAPLPRVSLSSCACFPSSFKSSSSSPFSILRRLLLVLLLFSCHCVDSLIDHCFLKHPRCELDLTRTKTPMSTSTFLKQQSPSEKAQIKSLSHRAGLWPQLQVHQLQVMRRYLLSDSKLGTWADASPLVSCVLLPLLPLHLSLPCFPIVSIFLHAELSRQCALAESCFGLALIAGLLFAMLTFSRPSLPPLHRFLPPLNPRRIAYPCRNVFDWKDPLAEAVPLMRW